MSTLFKIQWFCTLRDFKFGLVLKQTSKENYEPEETLDEWSGLLQE